MKLLFVFLAFAVITAIAQNSESTITGTIFADNNFTLYVNGKEVARDPVEIIPHNAVNVTFTVPKDEDIVIAIEARDWANDTTGLEYENRCVGDGGFRAMFSNGVVTNSSWVCLNRHYGPVNWKACVAAQMIRNQSLQLLPACKKDSTPPLEGCISRITPIPQNWTRLDFDDSRWDFALEYTDEEVKWGLPPTNCTIPGTIVSPDRDPQGNPITCPQNLNWGDSKFI